MPDVRFAVLGPLEVRVDGRVVPISGPAQRALLGALLLTPGRVVAVDRLVDAIWGEDPPVGARTTLQTYVARLRRALGAAEELVRTSPAGYLLDVGEDRLDAYDFAALVTRARAVGKSDPAVALALLDEAQRLWRGPAWGELASGVARGEALRLEELRLEAAEDRVVALLRAGRTGEAAGAAEALVVEHPLRDRRVALQIEVLAAQGRTADALAAYARHRDLLADELGLDPSEDLAELHQRVLRQELPRPRIEHAESSPAVPVSGGGPALSSIDREGRPPPLPTRSSSFVGRDGDLQRLRHLLETASLVTVVGPGGVGKTRLVHQLAVASGEPVWWVDLAAVRDPTAIPTVVADALRVDVRPGVGVHEALRARTGAAAGIVVLDNCEHVVTPVAHLVADLLGSEPKARFLATSRERLGIDGETALVLEPLAVPEPGDSGDSPAVELFLDRARTADHDFDPDPAMLGRIGDVVRELDGLPLAIELAASRVGSLTVDDLADRLDARFELLTHGPRTATGKHRTLRAVVDWSYDLLEPDERLVFVRLSVFAARFDLSAAEAVVVDRALPRERVADLVARLADRSMLVRPGRAGRGRYRMLETLRQYALSVLPVDELDRVRQRHAAWAVDFAERAERALEGPDELTWVHQVDEALGDLRAAYRWVVGAGQHDEAVRLVAALWRWAYWRLRSDVLNWGVPLIEADAFHPLLPRVCAAAAAGAWVEGRLAAARSYAARGIELAGGELSVDAADPIEVLGDVNLLDGDLDAAVAAYNAARGLQALAGSRRGILLGQLNGTLAASFAGRDVATGVPRLVADATQLANPTLLAYARYVEGEVVAESDPDRALSSLDSAAELADQVGNRLVAGVARTAAVALRGRHGPADDDALSRFLDVVAYWRTTGDRPLLLTALRNLVLLLARGERDEAAAELAGTVLHDRAGHPSYGLEAERLAAALEGVRTRLGQQAYEAARSRGASRGLEEAAAAASSSNQNSREDASSMPRSSS